MVKNALDIRVGDRLVPNLDEDRIVIVDYVTEEDDGIYVEGYYEDDGEEYQDLLESDDEVTVTRR
jgi:hypothetical protein